MEYRNLGRSGVKVSPLCVGTMTWGQATDENEAFRITDEAIDAGINFIDTANVYTAGKSEEIVGRALERNGKRDRFVLATKFTGPMGDGPNDSGSSRYHMIRQCEESLRRLRTDRIDLYQVHLMDLDVPLDEILLGLDTLVRQGKILYTGVSKFASCLIAEAVALSKQHGWPRFVTEQPPYNLLDRGVERELVFTCLRNGISLIPWAPLATGILSGRYRKGEPPPEDSRFANRPGPKGQKRLNDACLTRVEALREMAERKKISLADLSLAWLRHQPAVAAPILGMRKIEHLRSALAGLDIRLNSDELDEIDRMVPPGSAVSNYWNDVTFDSRLYPWIRQHRR